ncbi:MAG: transposase, partial [Desulfatirhabdiaceae bacterium]
RVGELLDMTREEEVLAAGKNRRTVHARSLLCYWAVEALGISITGLSTRLDISVNAVSTSVTRGRTLAKMYDLSLI